METQQSQAKPPTHAGYISERLFEAGMGYVIVCRFKSKGQRIETGVFLIDAWCLGIKNAFYTELTPETLNSKLIDKLPAESAVIPIDPCCARKLVEEAARYALNLGFLPHLDYKKGARVFGGLDAKKCQQEFVFGQNGKPTYMQGPNETAEQAARIVSQLYRRCGEGNYHFMTTIGFAEDLFEGEEGEMEGDEDKTQEKN